MVIGRIRRYFKRKTCAKDRVDPVVFVTGMPKSGTTAIVKLIGLATGHASVSDPFYRLDRRGITYRDQLFEGGLSIVDLMDRYPEEFQGAVLKDPNFIFFIGQLRERFPEAKWVFTIRDPRDNIRSILDRLHWPGRTAEMPRSTAVLSEGWRRAIDGRSPVIVGDGPIERLAGRWQAMEALAKDVEAGFWVSRYEDFVRDKEAAIVDLCANLGLVPEFSIRSHADRQFQPAGNSTVRWDHFFGERELQAIIRICAQGMLRHGYVAGVTAE